MPSTLIWKANDEGTLWGRGVYEPLLDTLYGDDIVYRSEKEAFSAVRSEHTVSVLDVPTPDSSSMWARRAASLNDGIVERAQYAIDSIAHDLNSAIAVENTLLRKLEDLEETRAVAPSHDIPALNTRITETKSRLGTARKGIRQHQVALKASAIPPTVAVRARG